MAITQDNRMLSIETDAGTDVLLLDHLAGVEQLSRPFHFEVTLLSERAENNPQKVDGRKLLGTSATITIGLAAGTERYINGLIRRFAEGERDGQFVRYRAEIAPAITLMSCCRQYSTASGDTLVPWPSD